jgi:C-terminal processing protease CtpA/Prc
LFVGGSAAKSGRIRVGDKIVAIGNVSVDHMGYLEAWKLLKNQPEGAIHLKVISRLD